MEAGNREGQERLIQDVINKGLCVKCGACVGLCPYFDYFDGRVVVLDRCNVTAAKCFQVCPMADCKETRPLEASADRQGIDPLGPYQHLVMARARDGKTREYAQYGGVVSTLFALALTSGQIEAAVMTDQGDKFAPKGKILRFSAEIISCAGSRYTGSGSLAEMNRAIKSGDGTLGVVGLPCQMEAVARMILADPEGASETRIGIRVGLFCTWAIDYRLFQGLLEQKEINQPVIKCDIPPPPSEVFQVQTQEGWSEIPLSDIRPIIQKGCLRCRDMTAQWADISVGMVEGREGWNTVLVRTDAGRELFGEAVDRGLLETRSLPQENLEHLKEAAVNKYKRAGETEERGLE